MRRLPWLLLLLALLAPGLAMAPKGQHVFWVPESAAWLMLWPLAALAAWWSTRHEGRLRLPQGLGPVYGGLLACWAVAAAFSLRPDLAARALGEWLGYAGVFYAVWRLAGTAGRRQALLALLLAYGVASSLYGILQALGQDPIPWATLFGGRASGFLGNPNFLGGHLALLMPVALARALDGRGGPDGGTRVGPWVVVGVIATGLILSQTRGAWVGAAVGCAVVLGLARRHMGGLLQRQRKPLLAMGALALLGTGAYVATHPLLLARLQEAFKSGDSELARRLFLMKKASQLASLRPLAGVGPGNFRIQFARVQVQGLKPEQYRGQPYVVSEHAHNDFLHMAAEGGLPAALLWAALMGLLAWRLLELLRGPASGALARQGEGLLALGVLGGLAALLVHGLANFPFLILPTQAAAWALAALALRPLAAREVQPVEPAGGPALSSPKKLALSLAKGRYTATGILVAGLGLASANIVWQGRRLASDRLWWIGQGELQLQRADVAAKWLLSAVGLDRREDRLWALHGRAELDRAMIWNSIGSLREAHRLAPYDPEVAVRLGRSLVENRVYDEAEKVLSSAAAYAPNFYDVWEPLAAAYYYQDKLAEAVQAYDWMIYFDINPQNAYVNKAAAQGSMKKLPEALLTLKAAEQRFPDSAKVHLNQAITYFKLGLRAEARAALKKAEALGPGDPQLEQLRKAFR